MKESNAPAVGRNPVPEMAGQISGFVLSDPLIIGFVVFKARPVAVLQSPI